MRTQISTEEITFYRDNGYVVLPDFLTADELVDWRQVVDGAVAGRPGALPGMPAPDIASLPAEVRDLATYQVKIFDQKVNLWQTDPEVARLIKDPRLGSVACQLAGVDGVRIYHDQALVKRPFANPTSYHVDVPYWSFTSPHAISMWVALDDATLANGCLYYLPGTHLADAYKNVSIGREIGALFELYPEWLEVAPTPAPVPAGGCIWHNGLTGHGAGANMTNGLRRAMTCGFMPEGSTFNGTQNILSDEDFARLTVGDALDDDDLWPLVYRR